MYYYMHHLQNQVCNTIYDRIYIISFYILKQIEIPKFIYYNFILVPDLAYHRLSSDLPPGLRLIENIITEEEEEFLLNTINWSNEGILKVL